MAQGRQSIIGLGRDSMVLLFVLVLLVLVSLRLYPNVVR